jgi:hypothetical protein
MLLLLVRPMITLLRNRYGQLFLVHSPGRSHPIHVRKESHALNADRGLCH